jgi:hypothetical protein
VKVSRLPRNIDLQISDNGIGFDPVEKKKESEKSDLNGPGSIFALDVLCQAILGADPIQWLDTAPGKGTRLFWRIPALLRIN